MRTQIEGFGLKDFFRVVGLPGWLLLAQPILFILLSRRRALNAYASVDASAVVFIIYAVICFYVGYKKIVESNTGLSKLMLFKSPLIWLFVYTIVSFHNLNMERCSDLNCIQSFRVPVNDSDYFSMCSESI